MLILERIIWAHRYFVLVGNHSPHVDFGKRATDVSVVFTDYSNSTPALTETVEPFRVSPDAARTTVIDIKPWIAREQDEELRLHSLRADEHILLASQMQRSDIAHNLLQEADSLARIAALLRLRADYVAKPPILRLPPEVFLIIASLVADAERPSAARPNQRLYSLFAVDPEYIYDSNTFHNLDEDGSLRPATIGWVKLAHVCRCWRRLCSDAPELWARGIGCLPRMLLEAMQRAGDHVPYDICVRTKLSDLEKDCVIDMLASRGRSLDWVVKDPSQIIFSNTFLSGRNFPALTYLRVKIPYQPSTDVVPEIASFSAPNVTTLDFAHFMIPFVAPLLTTLRLYYVQITPHMLLDILHTSPMLRRIEVSLSYGTMWEDGFEARTTCALPHLEALDMTARNLPGAALANFLRAMVLPSKASIELACAWQGADDMSELWEVAKSSFWRDAQLWGIDRDIMSVRFRMSEHSHNMPNATRGGRPHWRGSLDFTWQRRETTIETLMLQVIARPSLVGAFNSLQSVELLTLRLGLEEWRTILGQLLSVTTMSLQSGQSEEDRAGCDAFLQALAPSVPDSVNSEPLPKLLRLQFSSSCQVSIANVVAVIKRRSTYARRFPNSESSMPQYPSLRLGILDLRWKASSTLGISEMQDAMACINVVTWLDGWMGGPQSTLIRVDQMDVRLGPRFTYNHADGSRLQAYCISGPNWPCHCAVCKTFIISNL
ncbi:hypothetical protein PENSPDRAFT_658704 [Peniophora sp. CONT]|nr:hypothetical protein PENSPDRAFT_658704 [Peniophora sp. CONT]